MRQAPIKLLGERESETRVRWVWPHIRHNFSWINGGKYPSFVNINSSLLFPTSIFSYLGPQVQPEPPGERGTCEGDQGGEERKNQEQNAPSRWLGERLHPCCLRLLLLLPHLPSSLSRPSPCLSSCGCCLVLRWCRPLYWSECFRIKKCFFIVVARDGPDLYKPALHNIAMTIKYL